MAHLSRKHLLRKSSGVLITGTTSGIGLALLEHYARGGAHVIAVNRRRDPELEARYPSVRFECVDVRSADQVADLVGRLTGGAALPEVWILNAGINRVDNDEAFRLESYEDVIDTNLYGVLNFIQPLMQIPAGPVARHVIAIGSLAGHVGNPYGLGYHTSKQALRTCFDVWARMYAGTDLVFQQVLLGPVRTNIYTMADELPRWLVWLRDACSASLDGTVRAVVRFARTRRRRMVHPWRAVPLYLAAWLSQSLIPGFFRGRRTLDGRPRRTRAGHRPARRPIDEASR